MTKDPHDKQPSAADDILKSLDDFDKSREAKLDTGKSVNVTVSDDKLKAFVSVIPPMDTDKELKADDVKAALAEAGVTYGIDEEAITEIFTYGSYSVDVLVARGKAPTDGVSARIEYKFDTTGETQKQAQVDDQGNVDFRQLNIVSSVEAGAILAEKIPSVQGEPGMTVLGKELPPVQGRDVKLPVGENVEAGADGLTIIAKISGQPILKDGHVAVSPVFEVRGDINYTTGNIDFKGSVRVEGAVMSGFVVKATDDVDIKGNVEKAHIEAGGDVRVTGGLYGGDEGKVIAGGSITIRSVESGHLEAGKNVTVIQSARYSTILAGEDILLTNQRGSIVGGKATSGHQFDVANLGSPSFTETTVEVGMNPKIKEVYTKIEKELADHKVQREKIMANVKTLQTAKAQGHLPPEKEDILRKLVPAFHQVNAMIEQKSAKIEFLKDKMKSLAAGRCRVRGKTYPGVRISTIGASMVVRKEINHSSFYEQNEQIIVGPY